MSSITWLGQCGLYIDTGDLRIMTDPYLSDYLEELEGPVMHRLVPIDPAYLSVTPDVVILTHDHLDHTDMPTLKKILLDAPPATILASRNAFKMVKGQCGKQHNYVLFDEGNEWTQAGVRFKAIKACHSDEFAVGTLIVSKDWSLYLTGDTVYNEQIVNSLDVPVDMMFTVMNGKGNNMNTFDAARLTKRIRPKVAVPIHWGLFVNYTDDPVNFTNYLNGTEIPAYIPDFFKTESVENIMQGNM